MVNVDKLKGVIKEKRQSVETVATAIGVNSSTLYRRLNKNGDELTIKEVDLIVKFLNLTADEATSIFFAPDVA